MRPGRQNQACSTVEGWRDWYLSGVRRMLEMVPYDGVYYDFVSVYGC